MLSVHFRDRSYNPVTVPPGLQVSCGRISARMAEGFSAATIKATGDPGLLAALSGWLRYGVTVRNSAGSAVWDGYVNEIGLTAGGVSVTLSLDGMTNRARVAHTYTDPDGGTVRGTTDWVQSAGSVADYGTKELTLSLQDIEPDQAEGALSSFLVQYARPVFVPSVGDSGSVGAVLYCKGWFSTLSWRYFEYQRGRIEVDAQDEEQVIGWAIPSSDRVGFAKGRIHDLDGRLHAVKDGDRLRITGSYTNDNTYTVTEATQDRAVTVTGTTIAFEASDDIRDGYGNLTNLRNDEMLEITGSSANSDVFLQDSTGANHITVAQWFGPTAITGEASGPSITLRQGNSVVVTPEPAQERVAVSSTVTVTAWGQMAAQPFVMPHTWDLYRVAVQVKKVGAPSDAFTVDICADSSGSPGLVLATGTLAAANVGTELNWHWVDLGSINTGVAGTTYHLRVRRAGSSDPDNYYVIGIDSAGGAGGLLQLYNGVAWLSSGYDLAYRVWSAQDTGAQLLNVLQTAGQFFRSVSVMVNTGIASNQWRDGETLASTEAEKILLQGDSSGIPIFVSCGEDRQILVDWVQDDTAAQGLHWTPEGIRGAMGDPLDEGRLFAGRYLYVSLPGGLLGSSGESPRFLVGECEFDPETGKYTASPASLRDPWSFGLEQG